MKRFILISVAALVTAGVAYAAGQPPITAQPLAVGHVTKPFSINVSKPGDVMFVQVKILPGGSFGWHTHRAAVAVAVVAGTLTLYDSSDPSLHGSADEGGPGFRRAGEPRPPRAQRGQVDAPRAGRLSRRAARQAGRCRGEAAGAVLVRDLTARRTARGPFRAEGTLLVAVRSGQDVRCSDDTRDDRRTGGEPASVAARLVADASAGSRAFDPSRTWILFFVALLALNFYVELARDGADFSRPRPVQPVLPVAGRARATSRRSRPRGRRSRGRSRRS